MSIFSDRLKQLRRENKINQSELANAINKSRPTIAAYETDGRLPDIETLTSIANYFDEDIDWLLGRTDNRSIQVSKQESFISEEAFKVLSEMGMVELNVNSIGELVVNVDNENINKILTDMETQHNFLNSCLEKTLKLFSLPLEAKDDLANAILSIAIKYGAFKEEMEEGEKK